jgi:hypothetical protein
MEILYIYIDEYKKIKEQNINFGGKYRFHYDKRTKSLNVSENKQHIEGFYNKQHKIPNGAKICNVTSIIGENGVGKTSVLDFMMEYFVSGSSIESPFICAIQTEYNVAVYHFEVSIETDNCGVFKIAKLEIINGSIKLKGTGKTAGFYPPSFQSFNNAEIIHFSGIFDNRTESQLRGSYNLSTNFFIRHDLQSRVKMGVSDHNDPIL